jgi:hypothetical protein
MRRVALHPATRSPMLCRLRYASIAGTAQESQRLFRIDNSRAPGRACGIGRRRGDEHGDGPRPTDLEA